MFKFVCNEIFLFPVFGLIMATGLPPLPEDLSDVRPPLPAGPEPAATETSLEMLTQGVPYCLSG